MKDISKVWDDISQTEQADLLEIIAGKQRGNQVAALIQSFQSGQVEKALQASLQSENSAIIEHNKWLESLEAKWAQLDASFQSFSNTLLDSGVLKWFVDLGTATISGAEGFVKFGEAITTLGGRINGIEGSLGALLGIVTSITGTGKHSFSGEIYCAHPLKVA